MANAAGATGRAAALYLERGDLQKAVRELRKAAVALKSDPEAIRLLGRALLRQSEQIPDADFLVWDDVHYSFGRVNALANSGARAFYELGVRAGDTVAFLLESLGRGEEARPRIRALRRLGERENRRITSPVMRQRHHRATSRLLEAVLSEEGPVFPRVRLRLDVEAP